MGYVKNCIMAAYKLALFRGQCGCYSDLLYFYNLKGSDDEVHTQSHWACGLCPFSRVLNNQKTQRFGSWISFRRQVRGGRHLLGVCWGL
jgi:hypothetical protein